MRRLLVVLVAALALTACGDDEPAAVEAPAATEPSSPPTIGRFIDTTTEPGEVDGVFVSVGSPIPSVPQEPGAADVPRVQGLCDAADEVVAVARSFDKPWTTAEAQQLSDGISAVQGELGQLLDELGEGYSDALYGCLNRVQAVND